MNAVFVCLRASGRQMHPQQSPICTGSSSYTRIYTRVCLQVVDCWRAMRLLQAEQPPSTLCRDNVAEQDAQQWSTEHLSSAQEELECRNTNFFLIIHTGMRSILCAHCASMLQVPTWRRNSIFPPHNLFQIRELILKHLSLMGNGQILLEQGKKPLHFPLLSPKGRDEGNVLFHPCESGRSLWGCSASKL